MKANQEPHSTESHHHRATFAVMAVLLTFLGLQTVATGLSNERRPATVVSAVLLDGSVTLVSFEATPNGQTMWVTWETASEVDMLGFYVQCSLEESGEYQRISDIIWAEGGLTGATYEHVDADVEAGVTYYYRLEAIETDGHTEFHGPVSGTMPAPLMIYVNAGASGVDDGSSWNDAYVYLQDALDEANGHGDDCDIWVAEGVYYPDEDGDGDHVNDAVTETFRLNYDGVRLYGGFAGGESARGARDPHVHITVLSGDIDGNDGKDAHGVVTSTAHISGSNAYHVLWLDGVTNELITGDTVIDGFTITAGRANGAYPHYDGGGLYCDGRSGGECSPTVAHVTFSGNTAYWYGGGMINYGYQGISSPVLTNVTFNGNRASDGGGMINYGYSGGTSSPVLTDVTFSGNSAISLGGGMYNLGIYGTSSPVLTNVTFSGNSATDGGGMVNDGYQGISSPVLTNVTFSGNSATNGGGMVNDGDNGGTSSPVLTNVILWGNSATTGAVMYNYAATPTIAYSLVQSGCNGSGVYNIGGGSVITGDGNIDADARFVRDPDSGPDATWGTDDDYGDLRLRPGSPAIDAGDNSAVLISVTTDLAGNPRRFDVPFVDNTGNGSAPIVDMGAYEAGWSHQVFLPLVVRNY